MFVKQRYDGQLQQQYELVMKQLEALLAGEQDYIANLSNAAALLNQFLDDVNWVGFYINKGNELVLGPFQGLPACIRIPFGKGVCGTAAAQRKTLNIANVHEFPSHIVCDAASNSELVVPILKNGEVFGVLDIDSPKLNRFSEQEQWYLEQFVRTLEKSL